MGFRMPRGAIYNDVTGSLEGPISSTDSSSARSSHRNVSSSSRSRRIRRNELRARSSFSPSPSPPPRRRRRSPSPSSTNATTGSSSPSSLRLRGSWLPCLGVFVAERIPSPQQQHHRTYPLHITTRGDVVLTIARNDERTIFQRSTRDVLGLLRRPTDAKVYFCYQHPNKPKPDRIQIRNVEKEFAGEIKGFMKRVARGAKASSLGIEVVFVE